MKLTKSSTKTRNSLLSPTPPFLLVTPRLRLSGILGFICLVFPFTSSHSIIKVVGFIIGLGFFGNPLFTFGMALLNRTIPNWKDHMDIQKYDHQRENT